MRKVLSYFLIGCTVVTAQLLGGINVNAKPIIAIFNNSLEMESDEEDNIPMLEKVEQISSNEIQITYDRDVDMKLGTKSANYWIQDTKNIKPKNIATLGKDDKVNESNSLKDNLVKITSKDGSSKTFVLKFNQDISKGDEFKLIICYVTVPGAPAYDGDNGMATFVGK